MLTAAGSAIETGVAQPALLAKWRRRRRVERTAAVVLPLGVGAVCALLWQMGAAARTGGSVLLPTFTDFVGAVVRVLASVRFWHALWTSESALLLGFAIAVAAGIPLGLYVGRHRTVDGLVSGYLDIAVVTPTAVFMPLVIVVLGPTFWARVAVIAIFGLPFVVVPTRTGSATVPGALVSMTRSYCGSSGAVWREVVLPASVPAIFNGLRQGLAHALTGMVIIELTFLAVGIGRLIQDAQAKFDAASVFAVTFLIVAQGVAMMALLQRAQDGLSGQWRARS
ncbi:MAG: ABC transporter permease subunit [Streptosporangiales bacterium]|nr:ABC transporter permease subunit [Streptosporangiales bacterium]MBO0891406.1 ABC transporter permease subunit [Acidothermales bacterium]